MRVLLVVYDNESYLSWFPQGLAYIAAVLIKEGHEVVVYNQDIHHYPDEHLTEYLNKNRFDVVGIGVIGGYYQYRKLLKLSDAINRSKNRPFYIIGGHGPSPEPEFFLKKTQADAVVIGEGEVTVIELLDAIANHRPLATIKGIAFCNGGNFVVNERRDLIKDIDTLPFPAYDLFPITCYRLSRISNSSRTDLVMPVLSARGCPYKCTFCYRMDEGFRPRGNQNIIDEIMLLKERYGINTVNFADELLMSSIARTVSLCESFIRAKIDIKWACNGRLNYAKPDLLKLMKRAGCVHINYGIESMDDQVLKNMKKGLTVKQIIEGVENTLNAGINPGLNIIFGNIGDNKQTLNRGIDFLLKYDDGAQLRTIRPVTPYPGSELYYYAIEKGLLKDCEDFYENKHINSDLVAANFTDMPDDEFHRCLLDANTKLLTNYYKKKMTSAINQAKRLYLEKDASFRGYRHT